MATKVINSLTFGDTYVFTTPYATSSTAEGTQAKVATLTPNSNFSLETGVRVAVKFSAANTASSPTLNVNSSGAKTIQFRGAALTSSLYRWAANSVVEFMYDGTYWQMLGAPNNTNSTYTVNNATITLSAGTGLSGGGDFTTNQSAAETIKFSLATSGVTAGTYGPSADVSGSNGATITVPEITVDSYGRVTGVTNRTYTSVDTDTNTNTYGRSGNTSSKIYLIGTLEQSTSNKTTYSHDTAYVGTDGCLYSDSKKVLTSHQSVSNSAPTLTWGTTSTIGTVGGTALTVTMPANPSDTKVTQNAVITTSGSYPIILGNSTATTAVTGSVNKSATLLFDPSSSTLVVGSTQIDGLEDQTIGNLYVSGDAIIGGGSDSFGIIPGQDNYSHVGTEDRRWYQGHFSNLYCNNYFDEDGNSLTSLFLPTSGGTLTGATTVSAGVALQLNTLKLPTSSNGTTYGVGSSGQVLKSNGSTVYWGSDSNTTYSYPNIMGCSCTTAASTAAKTATLSGFSSTYLKAGATVFVRFTYAHTGSSAATLNITSSGAKTIYRNGKTITSSNANSWTAYEVVKMVYDGTYWQYYDTELTWNKF